MSKAITFKYVKATGAESERTLYVLSGPTENYKGIDLSELEFEEVQAFVAEAAAIQEVYLAKMQELQVKYDLKHNFRQFIPANMSKVETL